MMLTSAIGWCENGGADSSQIDVYVYNDAGVPPRMLERAEDDASRLFRRTGVNVRWSSGMAGDPGRATENGVVPHFDLRIVRHSRTLTDEIFGLAYLDAEGDGRQADIFYDGVQKLNAGGSLDVANLLGHVMAHELGHLLLGADAHSANGIMRQHWDESQLKLAAMARLGFDREQALRMQERIRRRTVDVARAD